MGNRHAPPRSLKAQLQALEIKLIRAALARHDGNVSAAARELEIHRTTLKRKALAYGLPTRRPGRPARASRVQRQARCTREVRHDLCPRRTPALRPSWWIGRSPCVLTARKKVVGVHLRASEIAGAITWVVEARRERAGLRLTRWRQGVDLPGSGVEREFFFPALCKYIAASKGAVVGVDAAFGLGRRVTRTDDWESFLAAFGGRYVGARELETKARAAAKGRGASRLTDRMRGRNTEPHRRRQSHRTFHWIGGVLAPLIGAGRARTVPMQEPAAGAPVLCEVAPVAYLRRTTLPSPFKGIGPVGARSRAHLLDELEARAGLVPDAALRERVAHDGEAGLLWAVVNAMVAARVAAGDAGGPPEEWAPAEGWAFC